MASKFLKGLVQVATLGGLLSRKKSGGGYAPLPSFPSPSAEEAAISKDVAAITDYNLETTFARMTGGMKIDEYKKIQDVLQMQKDYGYAVDNLKYKLYQQMKKDGLGGTAADVFGLGPDGSALSMDKFLSPAELQEAQRSGNTEAIRAMIKNKMSATTIQTPTGSTNLFDYLTKSIGASASSLAEQQKTATIVTAGEVRALKEEKAEIYNRWRSFSEEERKGLQARIDFIDAKLRGFGKPSPVTNAVSAVYDTASPVDLYLMTQKEAINDRLKAATARMKKAGDELRSRVGDPESPDIEQKIAAMIDLNSASTMRSLLTEYRSAQQDVSRFSLLKPLTDTGMGYSDGLGKFIESFASKQGVKVEDIKRTMSDIGLYDAAKGEYYASFQDAASANDGVIPAKQVQGLLAAQMEMIRTGNYDDAEAIGENIEKNYPEFYDEYFNPSTGFFADPMSPIQEMLKVDPTTGKSRLELEVPELANTVQEALKTALAAQGDVSAGITSNLQKASGLLDRAMKELEKQGRPATQANLENWLNDKLASGEQFDPTVFDAAKQFLSDAKKYLATPTQIQQAFQSLQNTGRIQNQEINDDTNWEVVQPPGVNVGRVITGQEVGAGGPMVPLRDQNGNVQTGPDGRPMLMPQMLADRYANLQSQIALGAQKASEVLAARGALDSSVAASQVGKLVNDIVGQQGRELEAQYLGMQQEAQVANTGNLLSQRSQDINMEQANQQMLLQAQQAKIAAAVDRIKAAGQAGQDQGQLLSQELGISLDQARALLSGAQTATQTAMGEVGAEIDYAKLMNDIAQTATQFGQSSVAGDAARLEAIGGVAGAAGSLAGQYAQTAMTQGQNVSQLASAATGAIGQNLETQSYNKNQPIQLALTNYDLLQGALGTANTFLGNRYNERLGQYTAQANSVIQQNAIKAQENASKNSMYGSLGSALISGLIGGGKGFSFGG